MRIGIYQSYWGEVGGGQRYVAAVAEVIARRHDVEIVHHCRQFDPHATGDAIDVDLTRIDFRYVDAPQRTTPGSFNPWSRLRHEAEWCAEISQPYDLFINCGNTVPFFCHAPQGLLITFFPETSCNQFHGRTTKAWRRRSVAAKLAAHALHAVEWRRRFAGYQQCITCSEYPRRWLRRLWGVKADVLYPPLRPGLSPHEKEPLVLSIGRFDGGRHKRQDVMVEAFKQLCDGGVKDWQFAVVGSVAKNAEAERYVDSLRRSAEGYPINIETDLSTSELRSKLERAAILWHAMGYGVDGEREPGRLEHFGMVATEAMATGCVPVLFNGGGLPESVCDGRNGFLWQEVSELVEKTRRLIDDGELRSRLSAASVERSADFSQAAFEERLSRLLSPVLRISPARRASEQLANATA